METQDLEDKLHELTELRQRVAQLERQTQAPPPHWQAQEFYTAYYATTGFMLGMFGAATSLLFNIIGSLIVGQHPLELIRIYLTFPLAERAADPEVFYNQMDAGMALAIGCMLYLATGMVLGVPFQIAMARIAPRGGLWVRLAVATALSLALWLINFYGILYWLQPMLFGGRWIVDDIPPWVAASTHLVFGWTMAIAYPWGAYVPYRRQTETQ